MATQAYQQASQRFLAQVKQELAIRSWFYDDSRNRPLATHG